MDTFADGGVDSQLVVIDRVFGWIQYNLVGIVAEFSKMTVVPMNIGGRSSTSETGQSELWRTSGSVCSVKLI